jgi:hypothetical protein
MLLSIVAKTHAACILIIGWIQRLQPRLAQSNTEATKFRDINSDCSVYEPSSTLPPVMLFALYHSSIEACLPLGCWTYPREMELVRCNYGHS